MPTGKASPAKPEHIGELRLLVTGFIDEHGSGEPLLDLLEIIRTRGAFLIARLVVQLYACGRKLPLNGSRCWDKLTSKLLWARMIAGGTSRFQL